MSEQVLLAVGTRIWPYGTEVQIIAVDDGSSPIINSYNDESTLAVDLSVSCAENVLSLIGLKVSVVMEKGDPRRVLIDRARAWKADSIFVGGRRFLNAIQRWQLGSVATALVTKAHCSVEVARNAIL